MTAPVKPIDTAKMSEHLRGRAIDISARTPPISRLCRVRSGILISRSRATANGLRPHSHIFRQHNIGRLADQPLAYRSACRALASILRPLFCVGLSERGLCLAVPRLLRPLQSFERRSEP